MPRLRLRLKQLTKSKQFDHWRLHEIFSGSRCQLEQAVKAVCTEKYDEWLEAVGIHQETEAGILKPPSRHTIVNCILDAWNELSSETICKSFNACALTSATDRSEDNNTHCLKEDQPCHTDGLKMLAEQMKLIHEQEENPFVSSN